MVPKFVPNAEFRSCRNAPVRNSWSFHPSVSSRYKPSDLVSMVDSPEVFWAPASMVEPPGGRICDVLSDPFRRSRFHCTPTAVLELRLQGRLKVEVALRSTV